MAKYLDDTGLGIVWGKVKEEDATNLQAAKNYADSQDNGIKGRVSTLEGYFNGSGQALESVKALQDGDGATISSTYIKTSTKGVANGVATLDANGKVPSSQIPGSVDEIIEGYLYNGVFYEDSSHTTAITGEGGKIYVDLTTNKTYRWSGSLYVEISESLAIGTTQGTAYDGASGAQLASDVSDLQTAVSTTIPNTYVLKQSTITNSVSYIGNSNGVAYLQATYKESGVNKRAGMLTFDPNNKYSPKISWIDLEQSPQGTNEAANFKINDNGIVAYINKTYMPNATFTYNGKEVATLDDIPTIDYPITDIKVNNVSVVNSKVVNLITNSAYNASTNKIATMNDIPNISVQDVKVGTTNSNASSVLTNDDAILLTNSTYDASTNKIATMADVPEVEAITSAELALILV